MGSRHGQRVDRRPDLITGWGVSPLLHRRKRVVLFGPKDAPVRLGAGPLHLRAYTLDFRMFVLDVICEPLERLEARSLISFSHTPLLDYPDTAHAAPFDFRVRRPPEYNGQTPVPLGRGTLKRSGRCYDPGVSRSTARRVMETRQPRHRVRRYARLDRRTCT